MGAETAGITRAAVDHVVEQGGHDAGCDGGNRIAAQPNTPLVKVHGKVGRGP